MSNDHTMHRGFRLWAGRPSVRRARALGALRVMGYVALSACVFAVWGVHSVYAKVSGEAEALGSTLLKMKVQDGEANAFRLNGEELLVSTANVDVGVKEILDRFESACNQSRSPLGELWATLPKLTGEQAALTAHAGMTQGSNAFRAGDDKSGVVLCMADREGAPRRTFVEAIESLVKTGELGQLGALRYVFARRGEHAEDMNTQLVMVWSDSPLSLTNLTGGDGIHDVAGADPTHIARPPESRRMFSISVAGMPYSFNLYRTAAPADVVRSEYDKAMEAAGYRLLLGPTEAELERRLYTRGMVLVTALVAPTADGTMVSLLETSRDADPPPPIAAPRVE